MALDVVQTKQEEFSSVMLAKLKEEKGSNLSTYAESARAVNGANVYNFYRLGEATEGTSDINMYADNYSGNGGTAEKVPATIEYIYATDKIKAIDLKSTSLDLESGFIKSLVNALKRNLDTKILTAIEAQTAKLKQIGDVLKEIDDADNVNELIEATAYAATNMTEMSADEGRVGIALVCSAAQYARLFKAEKLTMGDWGKFNSFTSKGGGLLGADVVKVAAASKTANKCYIIPKGTFGIASFEGDVTSKSWYDEGQDSLFCRARSSAGVAVIEPESIFEFTHKAIA